MEEGAADFREVSGEDGDSGVGKIGDAVWEGVAIV